MTHTLYFGLTHHNMIDLHVEGGGLKKTIEMWANKQK